MHRFFHLSFSLHNLVLSPSFHLLDSARNLPLFIHKFVFVSIFGYSLLMAKLLLHAVLHFCNSLFVLNANSSFKKLFFVCILGPQFVLFFLKHLRESLFDQLFVVAELLVSLLVRVCKSARRTNHNVRSIVGRFSFFRQRWRFRPIVKRMRFFVFFAATAPANMSISMHCVFA